MTELLKTFVSNESAAVVENPEGASQIVFICEHAGQKIPGFVASLGIDDDVMSTHIAWDIGAAQLARGLSQLLDAPLILQHFSRLVYDCNRDFAAVDAIVKESDHVAVPGNIALSEEQRRQRFDTVYQPFHDAIANLVEGRMQQVDAPIIVTIHSFTPLYKGQRRELELGIIYDADTRLGTVVSDIAEADNSYAAARNQPYSAKDGCTHTLVTHGVQHGLLNIMLEIRNDLLTDQAGQQLWTKRIAGLITEALKQIRH